MMHLLIQDLLGRIHAFGPASGDAAAAWGVCVGPTVLATDGRLPPVSRPRLVARAGFLPDEDAPETPDPRTWGPAGWSALEQSLSIFVGSPGPRLLIRPAASDVISDSPSCLRFLQRRAEWCGKPGVDRLGLLLDPIAMLAPSMHENAADHVERILGLVASAPGVDAVALAESPLVPFAELVAMFRAIAPAETPLVVAADAARIHAPLLGRGDGALV